MEAFRARGREEYALYASCSCRTVGGRVSIDSINIHTEFRGLTAGRLREADLDSMISPLAVYEV